MTWFRNVAVAFAALVVSLALGANLALAQSAGSSVTISDFQFTPATLQVAQGTTVTWANNGPSSHTSTSDSGAWDSGVLQAGKAFSFKFNTPGTFSYHCSIHPNTKGTMTVTAAAASPAASQAASASNAPAASQPLAPASPSAAATQASPSPSASKAAAPAQLPKTGGGGPGTPASTISPWLLLALVPLLGAGAWGVRRGSRSRTR